MFYSYCSVAEAKKRQFEQDIHVLEATHDTASFNASKRKMDPHRMVAKYYRSGTSNAFKGAEARNLKCLVHTLNYLMEQIWRPAYDTIIAGRFSPSTDEALARSGCSRGSSGNSSSAINVSNNRELEDVLTRYNFCMDRIAAVRQDLTVQRYTCMTTRTLLWRIAEFYLHSFVVVNYAPDIAHRGSVVSLPSNAFDMKNHEHALNVVLASIQQFTDMRFINAGKLVRSCPVSATSAMASNTNTKAPSSDLITTESIRCSERVLYYQAVLSTLFLVMCKSISTSFSRAAAAAAVASGTVHSAASVKKMNQIELDPSVGAHMHSYRAELVVLLNWKDYNDDHDGDTGNGSSSTGSSEIIETTSVGEDSDDLQMRHLKLLLSELLYPMLASIRQGNPSRVMKLARKYLSPDDTSSADASLRGTHIAVTNRTIINASLMWQLSVIYYVYALPELRLWRLFLLYSSSNITNNGPVVNKLPEERMRYYLQLSSDAAAGRFCSLCGFDVRHSEQQSATAKTEEELWAEAKTESVDNKLVPKDVFLSCWTGKCADASPSTKFTVGAVLESSVTAASQQQGSLLKTRQLLSVVDVEGERETVSVPVLQRRRLWTNIQLIRDYSTITSKWT